MQKKHKKSLKTAESQGIAKDKRTIEEGTQRIKTQEEFTKRAMEAAIQAQDVEKTSCRTTSSCKN